MNGNVHPEMLILARESRAMTQSELAYAVSIVQATYSKYERGMLKVSDEHLERIATTLHYPKSFFFQGEKRYNFGSSCTYHRKRQSLPIYEQRKLLANMNIERIRVSRLLDAIDLESENEFPHLDIDD